MTPSPEIVDEIAVRRELARSCLDVGGIEKFADQHKILRVEVGDVMRGRRSPTRRVLAALGYSKITRYMRSVSSPGVSLPGVGNSPASVGAFSSS